MFIGSRFAKLALVVGIGMLAHPALGIRSQICNDAFTEVYHQKYAFKKCPQNVKRFLEDLKSRGVALSEVQVHFLRDPFPPAQFRNPESRDGWEWHVVAEYQGMVYDFDYSSSPGHPEPEVISIRDYVDRNLGGATGPSGKIRIRSISADFFNKFWMAPLQLDGPTRRVHTMDATYMMSAPLGPAGRDTTVSEWVHQHRY